MHRLRFDEIRSFRCTMAIDRILFDFTSHKNYMRDALLFCQLSLLAYVIHLGKKRFKSASKKENDKKKGRQFAADN
jgi:hypothetical protein